MYFAYAVKFWDVIDEEEVTRYGVTCASCYSEAVDYVTKDYGDDCLDIHVFSLSEDDEDLTLEVNKEVIDYLLGEEK